MAKTTFFALLTLVVALSTVGVTPPNLDRAIESQMVQVEEHPTDPQAFNDLGNLLVLARQMENAELAYQRALELAPFDAEIRFNYALLLQQEGREEAGAELEQVLAVDPYHGWAHYQLGVLAAGQGNRKEALELYAQAFAFDSSLTFASNNPHIIDNELATEALLRSNHYRDTPGGKVPRYYGEAERIRKVMMGPEATEEVAPEAPVDPEDTPDPRDDATAQPLPQGGHGSAAVGSSATPRRIGTDRGERSLATEEVEPTRAERATPRRRGATYIPGAARGAQGAGAAATTEVESGGRASSAERDDSDRRTSATTPRVGGRRPPRARPGYRPPVRSTGRLDLELLPAEPLPAETQPVVRGR